MGLIHERKRRPKGLTKATTEIQEKENLIRQDFSADKPYTKLLTDISQIQCIYRKPYILPIIDCFNGEILSLIMCDNMKKELCIDTLKAARIRYPISGGPCIQTEAANIQVTVSELYWHQITYNKV